MNRVAKHMPCKLDAPKLHSIETQIWQCPGGYAMTAIIREGSKPLETHVWLWPAGREGELMKEITESAAANYECAQPKDRTLLTYRVAAAVNERIRELAGNQ